MCLLFGGCRMCGSHGSVCAARTAGVSITFLLLTLAPPALGVVAGYLAGGRLAGFRTLAIRHLWLVWVAAAVQFVQYELGVWRGPLLVAVFAIVFVWLGLNLRRWPAAIRVAGLVIVAGAALNALAIGLNGRMPYDRSAAEAAGLHDAVVTPKNMPADAGTRLAPIGDTIPVPVLHKVASPGDVLISVGAAALVVLVMRRRTDTGETAPRRDADISGSAPHGETDITGEVTRADVDTTGKEPALT